jgi:hypothetical protein
MTELEPADGGAQPSPAALRAKQQREMRDIALGSPAQWRGALMGTVVGFVLGALVTGLVGLLVLDTTGARVLAAVVGGLLFSVSGAVYEAGSHPERTDELRRPDGGPDESASVESNP